MPLVKVKPTSPGRRALVKVVTPELYKGDPHFPLVQPQRRGSGRNNYGRITMRHKGGGHKQHYREVDFRRNKDTIPATVERLEYDPNRSAHLALLLYAVTSTRTFSIGKTQMWELITSPEGLQAWLNPLSKHFKIAPKQQFEIEGGIFGEVRTVKVGRQARLTWQDADWPKPTAFNILIVPRPKNKCILVINHDGLKSVALSVKTPAPCQSSASGGLLTNPTDSTLGIVSRASIMRFCIAGILSAL